MTTIGRVETVEGETVTEWNIRDFFALSAKPDDFYNSPTFSLGKVSWYLSIYPNGMTQFKSAGFIGLFLYRESRGPPINIEFHLGLKTQSGNIEKEKHFTRVFKYNNKKMTGVGDTLLSRSELLERRAEFAPYDCLTVVCKLKYLKPTEITTGLSDGVTATCTYCQTALAADVDIASHQEKCLDKPIKCPECGVVVALKNWYDHQCLEATKEGLSDAVTTTCYYCQTALAGDVDIASHQEKCLDKPIKCPECGVVVALKDWCDHQCQETRKEGCSSTSSDSISLSGAKALADLKELFVMQEGCDVTITVKDQEFQAHKAILRARSSVFASAFRNDMKEKRSNTIEIEDCDPSSFPDFLSFLYCGSVEKLSTENAFSLFVTADKYDVQDLRLQCLDFIKNNLSANTLSKAVTMALQYTEEELLQLCLDFLAKNLQDVIMTVEWQSLLIENPIQCNELTIKALNRNKK